MPITRQMFESLQPGVNAITQGRNEANRATQEDALRQYLQKSLKGSIGPDGKYQPGTESAEADATTQKNIERLKDLLQSGALPEGSGANIGAGGAVSATKGYNLATLGIQNKKAEQQAYQQAANTYQHGISTNATSVQALHSLLGALQSNDPSSMGQIRTAMVLANGFKRYNDNEGTALTPDDKQADVSKLLGSYGLNLKDKTLSDVTRSNVVRFANNKLDELQDAHNTLKSQAQNMYMNSQFADPNKAANLGNTLGGPVDQQLQNMKSQFDKFHSQAISNTPAQGNNNPSGASGGLLSQAGQAIGKAFGFGGGQQQQAPAAAPGAPPVDEQSEFIKKFMAAKQAARQQAPSGQ